ncbi:MAG: hypothetical protein JNL73_18240 [Anaerolineales bacterium]|nr:hypothetical protein [Anaerolineales bacterium]
MADAKRKDVKQPFFIAWLLACLALVILVWADNLGPGEAAAPQPGFIRSTAPAYVAPATATPTAVPATATSGPIETQDITDDQ